MVRFLKQPITLHNENFFHHIHWKKNVKCCYWVPCGAKCRQNKAVKKISSFTGTPDVNLKDFNTLITWFT